MRASYYFAPVLLGVFGRAEVPLPGGCDIGARPIDQTVKGMCALGARVETLGGVVVAEADEFDRRRHLSGHAQRRRDRQQHVDRRVRQRHDLHPQRGPRSRTSSIWRTSCPAWARWSRARGRTSSASRGGRHLHGANYTVVPDQIETGTLMIAAAATAGDVLITGAIPTHMEALSAKLLEMGVSVTSEDDWIHVKSNGSFPLRQRQDAGLSRLSDRPAAAAVGASDRRQRHQHRHRDDL